MALNPGNAACTSGLSQRIYDGWTGDAAMGLPAPLPAASATILKAMAYRIAVAVVGEIQDHAEVAVTVSAGGLQRTPNPNNPDTDTQGPAAPVSLSGTVT